jgi:hypothetical protein
MFLQPSHTQIYQSVRAIFLRLVVIVEDFKPKLTRYLLSHALKHLESIVLLLCKADMLVIGHSSGSHPRVRRCIKRRRIFIEP